MFILKKPKEDCSLNGEDDGENISCNPVMGTENSIDESTTDDTEKLIDGTERRKQPVFYS